MDNKTITDKDFADLVAQYMTDEEKYEIECMDAEDAIEHFKATFGEDRWSEIISA